MRAIDILFDEINELNTEIVVSTDTNEKVGLVMRIRDIADIIREISVYHLNYNERDYL